MTSTTLEQKIKREKKNGIDILTLLQLLISGGKTYSELREMLRAEKEKINLLSIQLTKKVEIARALLTVLFKTTLSLPMKFLPYLPKRGNLSEAIPLRENFIPVL